MIVHRRSTRAPMSSRGTVQTLCGRYLHPLKTTDDPEQVECAVCERATHSQRTIDQRRLG